MGYKVEEVAEVLRALQEEGVDFVIIGDTSIQLALGASELEGDIDIFALEPSPLSDPDFYRELASRRGWEIGASEFGVLQLQAPTRSGYLIVDIYENFMDVEIPPEILERAREVQIGGARAKVLPPEYYLVLKARQGVDLDKLRDVIKQLKKKINVKLVEEAISSYPEDEGELIRSRLEEVGLELAH